MSTPEHAIEPSADDLADAIETAAQAQLNEAKASALLAQLSPLDQSLRRPNARQQHGGPTVWDMAGDMMTVPNMAFDPAQLTSLPEFAELEGYGVSLAVEAMKSLHGMVSQLLEVRETLRANPIKHESELALELDDLHSKLMPVVTKKLDAAHATISKAAAMHEAKLSEQVKDNASGAEIRGYVRSLPVGERMSVLQQAINKGDAVTVGALLGSPARYLTGLELSDEMHAAFLRQWQTKRDPETAKKLALARKAVAKLEAASGVYLSNIEQILGVREATIRQLRSQREKVRKVMGA